MIWIAQDNPLEVTPVDDLRQHDSGAKCWCRPFMDGDVIVHNALDNREAYEQGIRKPN